MVSGYCGSLKDKEGNGDFFLLGYQGGFSSSLILCLLLFRDQGSEGLESSQCVAHPDSLACWVVVCQDERIRENIDEEEMGAEGN